ncbi:Ligand-binding domain of nuclear hormone receptor [Aphelenchoides besseyi]|nr:Ligand-binding domain of nuclear hormone receptor [Aphelenchoides besseyi]KAI6198948.1 Ligand-binding domain of nuclear hormone receptor [Aphelenchoides besseyi]
MQINERDDVEWSVIDDFFSWVNKVYDGWSSSESNWVSPKLEIPSFESESLSKSPFKQKPRFINDKAPTNCAICNRPARCYHYSVPSCTGCKSFFRRSVVTKDLKYVCANNSKCNIKNGSKCRSCRLKACLAAGMDVRAIKMPTDSDTNSLLVNLYRQKRELEDQNHEGAETVQRKILPRFDQTVDSRIVDFLAYLELKLQNLRVSSFTGSEYYDSDIRKVLSSQPELGRVDKYKKMDSKSLSLDFRNWLFLGLLLNVEYLKAMPFFYDLTIEDQEALVVHVVLVNCILMESFESHQRHSTTLLLPDNSMPFTYRKGSILAQKYPEPHPLELESFCRNIEVIARVNPEKEEYFLLKAIIFCHSETPGLSACAQKQLEKYRHVYSTALLRRMQARRGTVEGARRYAELIGLVETFFHFAQRKREYHVFIHAIGLKMGIEPKLMDWFLLNSSRFD